MGMYFFIFLKSRIDIVLNCNLLIAFLTGTFGQWYRKGHLYQSSNSLGIEMGKKRNSCQREGP